MGSYFSGVPDLRLPQSGEATAKDKDPNQVTYNIGGIKTTTTDPNSAVAQARRAQDQAQSQADIQNQVKTERENMANDFESNKDKTKAQAYGNVESSARQNLASQMAGTRSNFNNRGLLYSGLRQGAELGDQANAGAGLAKARGQINQNVEDTAHDLHYGAIDAGFQAQKSAQALQDQIYGQALSDYQTRNNTINSVTGAAGMGAGLLLANRNKGA